jgi:hypothetical protein
MNRTLVIGGLVALAVLLGLASWLLLGSHKGSTPSTQESALPEGPIALNPVSVITKTGTTEGPDGRTLNVLFSDFELRGSGHEVKTAVFSTTWHVKLQPGERVAVATADVKGYMSSSGAQPQPVAQPATATPATTGTPATPASGDASTPPATTPTPAPAPAPPPRPVAGEGIATVFVSVDGTASSSQWKDSTGEGADRIQTQAAVFSDPAHELRNGGEVPVTVTVELNSNGSTESVMKIRSVDLRLFVDSVPEATPAEPAPTTPATPAPAPTPSPTNP